MLRLAAALLLCAACGGRTHWSGGDPELFGVVLAVDTRAPFVGEPDFRPRLRRTIEATSRYFGHDPRELEGLMIVVENHWSDCASLPGQTAGCYTTPENVIRVSMAGFQCLEGSAIAHELLHYFIEDWEHTDPRWHTFGPLWSDLVPDGCRPFSTD